MWQAKCGCWYSAPKPNWKPWRYKRGQWETWKPISIGGDEWCRWTLVLGIGPITGVWIFPVRWCRGKNCEACGPGWVDNVLNGNPNHRKG